MAYATKEDFMERFDGEITDLLAQDGAVPTLVQVDRILAQATSEMDSYIGRIYPLPLIGTYLMLNNICCDIARFRLHKNKPHDEVVRRYSNAITWLNRLIGKKVILSSEGVDDVTLKSRARALDFSSYCMWDTL